MYRELNIDTDYDKPIVDAIVDDYFVDYLFNSDFNYFKKSILPLLKINLNELKNNYGFKSELSIDNDQIEYEFIIDTPFGKLNIYFTIQDCDHYTEILSIGCGSNYMKHDSQYGYFSSRKTITFDEKIGHHFSIKATKSAYK